jgi:hypothetical protein
MHPSSLDNMQTCIDRYVDSEFVRRPGGLLVLDVGGEDVNGGYRDLFKNHPVRRYIAVDLREGPGVDVVLDDPYVLPFQDNHFDIVISGQMLEHCPLFWRIFVEMVRTQKNDGLIFMIAPSAGPIHQFPTDCYRFYPDAYAALADYANCRLVDCWLDERGPWRDLTGVFARSHQIKKVEMTPYRPRVPLAVRRHPDPQAEVAGGEQPYLRTLRLCHDILKPELYLEIGVRHGESLRLARRRAIGVDPAPELTIDLAPYVSLASKTSDAFFDSESAKLERPIDFALIDGLHLFEFALRDFINLERRATPASLIVIDDVFPNHPLQAARERATAVWTGDVWKLGFIIAAARPDLMLIYLNTTPSGLLLITALDPVSTNLVDSYNPIVRAWQRPERSVPPSAVLNRRGARSPLDKRFPKVLLKLRELRLANAKQTEVAAAVRAELA